LVSAFEHFSAYSAAIHALAQFGSEFKTSTFIPGLENGLDGKPRRRL